MVWFKWVGNKRKKRVETAITLQDVRKEKEVINGYCFFVHSYVIQQKDSKEREAKDRAQYEDDKRDHECEYTCLIDRKSTKKIYVWDGYEERLCDIMPDKPIDNKMFLALTYLKSKAAETESCNIKEGYDYAWIKLAIDKQQFIKNPMERFIGYTELINYTYKDFVDYIKRLGFNDICGDRNVERYYMYAEGQFPNFRYKDCEMNQGRADKRNRIIKSFIAIMNSREINT